MRPSVLIRILLLLGFSLLVSQKAQAQYVIGYSDITFDDTTNSVFGYSVSELDYFGSFNYQAYVEGYLYDQAGNILDSGSDTSYFLAVVITHTAALPGRIYTVYSDHYLIAYYYTTVIIKEPEGCWPCDGCNTDCYYYYENWYWWDPFGFGFLNPGYYGDWWDFWGDGIPANLETEYIYVGTTGDYLVTPPDYCRLYSDSDPPPESYSTSYSGEALSCAARPYITGQHELWYFDGVSPVSHYATEIILTAHPADASSYQWTFLSGGQATAAFIPGFTPAITTTTNQVIVSSTGQSFSPNDTSVIVTVNGVSSARFKFTVRAPYSLRHISPDQQHNDTYLADSTFGYDTRIAYDIYDQFGTILPNGPPINEYWTTGLTNLNGANWHRQEPPGSITLTSARFADKIQGENYALPPNPWPTSPQSPLSDTVVQYWGQDWRVGSLQPNYGRRVQSDYIQKYIDHAEHSPVFSPNP
jgi:hypothetical protein